MLKKLKKHFGEGAGSSNTDNGNNNSNNIDGLSTGGGSDSSSSWSMDLHQQEQGHGGGGSTDKGVSNKNSNNSTNNNNYCINAKRKSSSGSSHKISNNNNNVNDENILTTTDVPPMAASRRICIAVDYENFELSKRVVHWAMAKIYAQGDVVDIVYVYKKPEFPKFSGTSEPRYALWEDMKKEARLSGSELLYEMERICRKEYNASIIKLHLFEGDAKKELVEFCKRHHPSSKQQQAEASSPLAHSQPAGEEAGGDGQSGAMDGADRVGAEAGKGNSEWGEGCGGDGVGGSIRRTSININKDGEGHLKNLRDVPIDLLVVGSRGRNAISSALLGSVSHYCALHCACPVVIVR
eukprot:Nk52_evm47s24 gene=Nk52_evmTU47s24